MVSMSEGSVLVLTDLLYGRFAHTTPQAMKNKNESYKYIPLNSIALPTIGFILDTFLQGQLGELLLRYRLKRPKSSRISLKNLFVLY